MSPGSPRISSTPAKSRLRAKTYIVCTALLISSGCSKSSKRWFSTKSSQTYVNMALDSESPDERREGVNGLANSKDANTEWAVKVYDTIARTDKNPAVRSAAVQALGNAGQPSTLPTILKILRSPPETFPDVKPATSPIRWDAAKVLNTWVGGHVCSKDQEQEVLSLLLNLVTKEPDRNVRLVYVEMLGSFPQREVLQSLIDLLGDEDFAIVRASEKSLIALTGTTHQHNAQQWRDWLAQTQNPFAHAGEIPEGAEPKSKSNWSW